MRENKGGGQFQSNDAPAAPTPLWDGFPNATQSAAHNSKTMVACLAREATLRAGDSHMGRNKTRSTPAAGHKKQATAPTPTPDRCSPASRNDPLNENHALNINFYKRRRRGPEAAKDYAPSRPRTSSTKDTRTRSTMPVVALRNVISFFRRRCAGRCCLVLCFRRLSSPSFPTWRGQPPLSPWHPLVLAVGINTVACQRRPCNASTLARAWAGVGRRLDQRTSNSHHTRHTSH
jgi:hypothetical protein